LTASADDTTASFSIGLYEHVEYTSRPPGLSIWIALLKILNCNVCSPSPSAGFQKSVFVAALPDELEEGSEGILMLGMAAASRFVIMQFGLPILLRD
jgi:hypothetical protein